MTTRTSQPAGGVLLIAEMKEFASFSKATQRYLRRSLDIAFGRTDPIATWARDEAEAASIRAQGRFYKQLDHLRLQVPDDSGLDMIEPLSGIASEAGMSLAQMALAFPLAHPGVTGVNFGVRNMRQFNDAKSGFGLRLSHDVLDAIDACNPPGSIVDEADRGWIMPWMAPEARRRQPFPVA